MTNADVGAVTQHYAASGIADRVLSALRAASGPDAPVTPDTLAPLDHFHGRGLVATKELVHLLKPEAGELLLDIGCGIGGPARWIASHHGCHVTGIDLTPDFCTAADALTLACGMAENVCFVVGSATELPFAEAAFDRVYSQNVIMNIADKARFYVEARRVVKPGGLLAFSNIGLGATGSPHYPVPWATSAATSFLSTPAETREQMRAAGLEIVTFRDTTDALRAGLIAYGEKVAREGLPKLGPHAFMGARMAEFQANSTRNLIEGRTCLLEALARRPG